MSASSTTTLENSSASPDKAFPNASRRESPVVAIRAGASLAIDIQQLLDLVAAGAKRIQRVLGLLPRQLHAAVPGRNILHVGNALALDGVRDDHRRAIARRVGAAE